jgi:diguanylate cyclase (GGDEF)-like protein
MGRRVIATVVAGIAAVAVSVAAMRLFPSAAGYLLLAVILVLVFLLFRESERAESRLQSATSNLEIAESIDHVTRLASRGRFFERLGQEFRRSQRYQRSLSCIMLDLDHFSSINEQFGERYGDTVLADFASLFARDLRDSDLAARFEGEAFAIILPETPTTSAEVVAERIRARLKQHVFSNGVVACSLTASFGIAGVPDGRITRTDDLVRVAMQALAESKRRGRDRIVTDLPATATAIARPDPEPETEITQTATPKAPIKPASSNS